MSNHDQAFLVPGLCRMEVEAEGQAYGDAGVGGFAAGQYVNHAYRRSATLWEGRFRSCLAQEEHYVMGCQRYIELNPVRADMVEHPAEYRWSSYRVNGQGEQSRLITSPPLYDALGESPGDRQVAYRELFRYELDPGLVDEIRKANNGNYVLGTERFEQVAAMLGRWVSRAVKKQQPINPSPDLLSCADEFKLLPL